MNFSITNEQREDSLRVYNELIRVKQAEIDERQRSTGKIQKFTARAYIDKPAPSFQVSKCGNGFEVFYITSDGTLSPSVAPSDDRMKNYDQDEDDGSYCVDHKIFSLDPSFTSQIANFITILGRRSGATTSSDVMESLGSIFPVTVKFRNASPCLGYFSSQANAPQTVTPATLVACNGCELDVCDEDNMDLMVG